MVLPTRFRPQKTNANYPADPAPGRKRFHAALNLLNSHLSQPRCGIVEPRPARYTFSLMVVLKLNSLHGGAVAQLGARLDGIEEVVGSNPIGSTI